MYSEFMRPYTLSPTFQCQHFFSLSWQIFSVKSVLYPYAFHLSMPRTFGLPHPQLHDSPSHYNSSKGFLIWQ